MGDRPAGRSGLRERLAALAVVAVKLASRRDGDPDRRPVADRLDVVPEAARREDPVTGLDVDRLGVVLVLPGQLALVDEPGLVLEVVVVVVRGAGRLVNDRDREVLVRDDPLGPLAGALRLLELLDPHGEIL